MDKIQNHTNEGKGNEKRKKQGGRNEEKKKSRIALVVFIMATLQIVLGLKKLLGTKGPFGGNVFKSHTGQAAFLQSLSCMSGSYRAYSVGWTEA